MLAPVGAGSTVVDDEEVGRFAAAVAWSRRAAAAGLVIFMFGESNYSFVQDWKMQNGILKIAVVLWAVPCDEGAGEEAINPSRDIMASYAYLVIFICS